MIEPNCYYTITEAAQLTNCHRSTILRDVKAGILPFAVELKGNIQRKLFKGSVLMRYRQRTLFLQ